MLDGKMISYCRARQPFVIVTESGMLHRLRREMPDGCYPRPTDSCACADCTVMKMNTLEAARLPAHCAGS
jgi:quinolinate synthase